MAKVVACPACGTKNRVPAASTGHPRCASCKQDLPWLVEAGDRTFDAVVDTPLLVVLDLWAPWCGPCRMIAPILDKIAVDYAGRVKVVKVNVDDNPDVSYQFKVQSIPLVLLLKGGQTVDTLMGAQSPQAYRQKIDAALA
ncbi:thioredoxin [Propioniciclava sp. MC1683]|uniref:thioredoxin n=1 Tax=Propioniciclava sp. MC1683 TaxID=2760309 RepID=UPI0016046967|nr:thioredoxin [Propioniciclava sp. MC1683]MBB1502107.1 thioredoxin [Propioniciclava sp. MC1683]